MQTQEQTADIKTRIAELRQRYLQLVRNCSYGARINSATIAEYAKQLQTLQAQLK